MRVHISPFAWPIVFFGVAIVLGAVLLHLPLSVTDGAISWTDALFTAVSAVCVTGLIVVDTGSFFSPFGQGVILGLIQIGGLGIMTITSLIFYLWRQRVSLTDHLAVGKSLIHDPRFKLGGFLIRITLLVLVFEALGAVLLRFLAPQGFSWPSAVFHAVSAFCNAGFALQENSLVAWQGDWAVNGVFMGLIICGGIGFSVLVELGALARRMRRESLRSVLRATSWYTRVVLSTTAVLLLGGAVLLLVTESTQSGMGVTWPRRLLTACFQSVTCRTAGFNTVDIGAMTNVSLLIMAGMMFIGGAPGSCAGGVKVTTARTLIAFVRAQLRGGRQRQAVIGRYAVEQGTMDRALLLLVFALGIVVVAVGVLNMAEGGHLAHAESKGLFLELMFEAVSAFGTVGLSTGLTPTLSAVGKYTLMVLMFVGRLGPILFLTALKDFQKPRHYAWPEHNLLIG